MTGLEASMGAVLIWIVLVNLVVTASFGGRRGR